ncbi:hypothetical protein D3C73_1405400 [compost metagenome]
MAQWDAVQQDFSAVGRQQSYNELGDCALASTRSSSNSGHLTGWDHGAGVVQHPWLIVGISEVDVAELNFNGLKLHAQRRRWFLLNWRKSNVSDSFCM